jgi:hypothetical protein
MSQPLLSTATITAAAIVAASAKALAKAMR